MLVTVFNAEVLNPPGPTRAAKTRKRQTADDSAQPKKNTLLDSIPLDTAQILSDFQGAKFSFAGKSS